MHLLSIIKSYKIGSALIDSCCKTPYTKQSFIRDLIAGVTVGIIAIPLAMALAIASGVPPQHGLYTAIIAGLVIAITGGSKFSVSGPTAAFVVILYPVSVQYGLSGLLVATFLSGIILLIMGFTRTGRLIEYIPIPVVLGFTSGIAITIATMQIKDFFGLTIDTMPESYIEKVQVLIQAMPTISFADTVVGVTTFLVLIFWHKIPTKFPCHLPAVLIGVVTMLILNFFGYDVATIGSRFSYELADGTIGQGIPPILPQLVFPWELSDAKFTLSTASVIALIPIAFTMALLCAIESLLCALVIDEMTDTKHNSNAELIGQGLGNIIAPFFGGISATAAIARSVANYRAGAVSPVSSIIHALFVLLVLLIFAQLLSYLPLSAMSAILLIVAWNMSAANRLVYIIKRAPNDDIICMLLCLSLTVLFDMVIAIPIGIVVSSLFFMRRIADMTKIIELKEQSDEETLVIKINGPLFFAAAEKIFNEINDKSNGYKSIILHCEAVTILDIGGVNALNRFIEILPEDKQLLICSLQYQPLKTLAKAKIMPIEGRMTFYSSLDDALNATH